MIPNHNQSGVLPPYIGISPAFGNAQSPYRVSFIELAQRFATNLERIKILEGLIAYRDELRKVGFSGFQWINGSFVENSELIKGRPPEDIDIITFLFPPNEYSEMGNWHAYVKSRPDLFDSKQSKIKYFCHSFWVNLRSNSKIIVKTTIYYFGLFSHQKETDIWKGMLEVSISDNDDDVIDFLNRGEVSGT